MSLPVGVRIPRIGITMGDAAGIGPEIVLKALADKDLRECAKCLIIGDLTHLRELASKLAIGYDLSSDSVSSPNESSVQVVDLKNLTAKFSLGEDAARTGRASAEYISCAVECWKEHKIDAICTAPISKKAWGMGGYEYPGHTEFLAAISGTREFRMSFFGGKLRVVLLSTHMSLQQAITLVKKDAIVKLIAFSHRELGRLLGKDVSLAVAGLNPHASEDGLFGSEEKDEIIPAIQHCRTHYGIDVAGPFSPDTIFLRAYSGEFDGVIALYHDQATIAVKSLCFGSAANVTLGLPFIRTSVDHGTAFDIAGKGIADPSSMRAAIRLAADMASSSPELPEI
jgi:4-hydroxythreonine-4-phosphate dehydrogenase